MPEVLRVGLLGGFRVSIGTRSVGEGEWRLRKAASLVKLLALAEGHRMHQEQAMEHLWPTLPPKPASNNLRQAIHAARRALEPDPSAPARWLRVREGWLTLCAEGQLWVDVEAFERAAGVARRVGEPAAFRAAIDLYGGELLPEDRYEGWAEERREALRRTHLALLIELAGLHEERGQLEAAIAAFARAVGEDPAEEEAHVGLMRLYASAGRRKEAIEQYRRLGRVLSEELDAKPGEPARLLYERIAAGQPPEFSPSEGRSAIAPAGRYGGLSPKHNLPAERTSFVGREEEMVEVERLLSMTRLLTLTGAGGTGKTRFALRVAKGLVETYPDGAWMVELAPLSDPELVERAVAEALGVREEAGHPLTATLEEHLSSRELLLLLDNCEHLIEGAARVIETFLDSCEGLRVLATSREALNVAGELTWWVAPLSVPDLGSAPAVEDLVGSESVRLFVERARYRRPGFDLNRQNAQAVAEVCRRLDGMPLAIELAAARVGTLSVGQIAARLGDSLELLTGGRTATARQRTLKGALDWSYGLLSETERVLFGRLSVFAGGWTLEAAEAVVSGEEDVLDVLLDLVDKSLVVAEDGGEGDVLRYRMLEPVSQYARDRLEEDGEAERIRECHARYYMSLAEEAEPELRGAGQEAWLERLEREHSNLRAALGWALRQEDTEWGSRLAVALERFWWVGGYFGEGRRWLESGLTTNSALPANVRAKALNDAGWIALYQHDLERAVTLLEESVSLFMEAGDEPSVATSLFNLGHAVLHQGDKQRLQALCEEAETLRREKFNDRWALAELLVLLGMAALYGGDHEQAVALLEESMTMFQDLGDKQRVTLCVTHLWMAELEAGDRTRARALLEENLRLLQRLGIKPRIYNDLLGSALMAALDGRPARAVRLWASAEALREAIGLAIVLWDHAPTDYEGQMHAMRSQLGEEAFVAAWEEGKEMAPELAIAYALSGAEEPPGGAVDDSQAPREKTPKLTSREREIADLVARQMTNRQIASELTISEHTAATHVRRILKKLGLRSRAQIAARTQDQGPTG